MPCQSHSIHFLQLQLRTACGIRMSMKHFRNSTLKDFYQLASFRFSNSAYIQSLISVYFILNLFLQLFIPLYCSLFQFSRLVIHFCLLNPIYTLLFPPLVILVRNHTKVNLNLIETRLASSVVLSRLAATLLEKRFKKCTSQVLPQKMYQVVWYYSIKKQKYMTCHLYASYVIKHETILKKLY